ncbi:MAG: DUF885 family protein [Rhodothermales bacterium]|nr:DUF885 family protein [Rhodothermales bacterium]
MRPLIPTALLLLTACAQPGGPAETEGTTHDELVAFYQDWRAFHAPPATDGVYDYSASAMAARHNALPEWQARLASFDTTGWPIPAQVDWHLVRAEMNGLDFDHRVMQPWANNPAWYVQIWMDQSDTPEHEGPLAYGFIDVWKYDLPSQASELEAAIRTIPAVLAAAPTNLTGNQQDLWRMGLAVVRDQHDDLERIRAMADGASPTLSEAISEAQDATMAFADWLEAELPSKTGSSGLGIENYDWYLKNVHLSPYGWAEEMQIVQRELARSYTALRLEENNNHGLPAQNPIDNAADFERLQNLAVDDFIAFFAAKDIVEMKPYFDPALRAQVRPFSPEGPQHFFYQVIYRDPIIMQTHWYHWIDLERMRAEPHPSPIRANPLLYNIWDSRSEGLATAMEEMMMHAGFIDGRPRSRELIWILVAQRAARAIAGLRMHSNEWTLQEASDYAVEWTPRGWMQPNGQLVGFEQHLYLMQPGYGTSYLTGKAQIETLLAEYQHATGQDFTIRRFFDHMNDTGLIPAALIQWEMTGKRPAHL